MLGLRQASLADEERVHAARVVHAHAVRADDAALVLFGKAADLRLAFTPALRNYLRSNTLLGSRLTETARYDGHPLGAALEALLQGIDGELGGNRNNSALNGVGDFAGRFVDGLVEELSTYKMICSRNAEPLAFTKYVLPLNL